MLLHLAEQPRRRCRGQRCAPTSMPQSVHYHGLRLRLSSDRADGMALHNSSSCIPCVPPALPAHSHAVKSPNLSSAAPRNLRTPKPGRRCRTQHNIATRPHRRLDVTRCLCRRRRRCSAKKRTEGASAHHGPWNRRQGVPALIKRRPRHSTHTQPSTCTWPPTPRIPRTQ